jgi:hypothetical protein
MVPLNGTVVIGLVPAIRCPVDVLTLANHAVRNLPLAQPDQTKSCSSIRK